MTPIIIHKRGGAPTRPRRWRSLRLNLYLYAALVLALFLGTIQAAKLAGVWSTSGKVTASGEQVQITGADPAEVKGWMTVKDVGEVASHQRVVQSSLPGQPMRHRHRRQPIPGRVQ